MSSATTRHGITLLHAPDARDRASVGAWLTEMRQPLRQMLLEHGVILVRGLPLHSAEDFAVARDTIVQIRAAYKEKATPRHSYGDDIFSSTDLPASQGIRLHNENSYTLTFPRTLLFCCLAAPTRGGATIVGRTPEILRLVPDELSRRFEAHGWLLVRTYSELVGLPWQAAFGTDDREQVAAYCAENLIEAEWDRNGTLRTIQRRSAVVQHPATGERLWFNHIAFWNQWSLDPEVRDVLVEELGVENLPFNTAYGDGTPITVEEAEALNRAYEQATLREPWQPGDLLIVDNLLAAHGRDPYHGERNVLVAMGDPVDLYDCKPSPAPSTGLVRPWDLPPVGGHADTGSCWIRRKREERRWR